MLEFSVIVWHHILIDSLFTSVYFDFQLFNIVINIMFIICKVNNFRSYFILILLKNG